MELLNSTISIDKNNIKFYIYKFIIYNEFKDKTDYYFIVIIKKLCTINYDIDKIIIYLF